MDKYEHKGIRIEGTRIKVELEEDCSQEETKLIRLFEKSYDIPKGEGKSFEDALLFLEK